MSEKQGEPDTAVCYREMGGAARQFLTLNQFMLRGQVLKQYRDFLRTVRRYSSCSVS